MSEFNPYQSQSPASRHIDVEKYNLPRTPPPTFLAEASPTVHSPLRSPRKEVTDHRNVYQKISDMFGFQRKYSLGFFFVFGGALLGFCLSKFPMFDPKKLEKGVAPGEWYWYSESLFKINLIVHIYLVVIGGILSGIQFIPLFTSPEKRNIHRINGYIVALFLVASNVTGAIAARHSFGGDLNTQSSFYLLAVMITLAIIMGLVRVKNIPEHRKWMLRAIVYLSTLVTARILRAIVTDIVNKNGNYYAVWGCDEIRYMMGNYPSEPIAGFPECVGNRTHTAIRAVKSGGKLGKASITRLSFSMTLWVAIVLHTFLVELYLFYTEKPEAQLEDRKPNARTEQDQQFVLS